MKIKNESLNAEKNHFSPSGQSRRRIRCYTALINGDGREKSVVISSVAAVITLLALCLLLSGAPSNAGLIASLDPVNAVSGLAFALSFGAGIPAAAAIVAAVAVLTAIPFTVFFVVRRVLTSL